MESLNVEELARDKIRPVTSWLLHEIYLYGLEQWEAPRWARRLLAKTKAHRSWHSGYMRYFIEDGVRYGPSNPYPSGSVTVIASEVIVQ
jgi:hypothetical protein